MPMPASDEAHTPVLDDQTLRRNTLAGRRPATRVGDE